MAALKRRHNRWEAKVRVPREAQAQEEGRQFLYLTIATADKRKATAEAEAWEALLRAKWGQARDPETPNLAHLRRLYEDLRAKAVSGAFKAYDSPIRVDDMGTVEESDPVLLGIEFEIEKIAEAVGPSSDPPPEQAYRLAALQDAAAEVQRLPVTPRRELELTVGELAEAYMDAWRRQGGLKDTNTAQQKRATFGLFAGFWGDRPIREVTKPDAARFIDALKALDPKWGRSPAAKLLGWTELLRRFGGAEQGPSDATMNRHAATLKALWEWAADRGHCEGRNPFGGFHRRLQMGRNVKDYRPWEAAELRALLEPPPKRRDLLEVMLVGMFSGMRLDEVASLRWGQLREAEGIPYVQVENAKTRAGERQVPLHPSLGWLWERPKGAAGDRVWAAFNPEGPGKKAGADAGREFSRFKAMRGFTDRQKTFHSFRKNVVGQLEAQGVPESEVAQIVGHEKDFTFGRYGQGVPLRRKAEIIAGIAYPGVELPPV
jgi:integrase